ncbi:ABC transporter ATP-binding protein [Dethiobacter alkaliphilus]|uniref:ABC transporter ATP-binding protein n=1 Tax=Dethiobacter alkaliphilus TaxID=427926 RepID=UPI0022271787|nr:ABC transporter ATP-binding protein [Dethiobacter alkaliphilus]MCW3490489.1 ABC transporter ATP-binding protein [Dethiobacter alkaliphilus]
MTIRLKDIVKCYNGVNVVDNISLTIEKGELFGFLGPNGAGKTTCIRMMIGLLKPTQGEVWVNNHNVLLNKKRIYPDIGVVFEQQNLYIRSSIRDNLKLFGDLFGVTEERINKVMEELELSNRQHTKVAKLSKGWKQRVLIARALLHKPKVLFLDEPTSGLDPNTAALIRNYIKNLNKEGTTVVLTTHDMNEANDLSERVGFIHKGELVAVDTPNNLKNKYGRKEIQIEYVKGSEVVKVNLPMDTDETNKFVSQLINDGKIINMHTTEGTLSEVFAALTGRELS